MITPTIGRVMWYRPMDFEVKLDTAVPFVAHVCYVWDPALVNVMVIDHNGYQSQRLSVPVWQGDYEDCPEGQVCWMPYQKGQAAKTEAAEKELAETQA